MLAGLDSPPDAVILDGDHNYFTLSEELRLIAELAGERPLPLLLFHDVCWPHARRDTYYDASRIPEDERPPIGKNVGLFPGEPGTDPAGLPYPWAALREGGPRNGTVTAIEDFMGSREGLRFAIVPAFFGFGVVWPEAIRGCRRARRAAHALRPSSGPRAAGAQPRRAPRRRPRRPGETRRARRARPAAGVPAAADARLPGHHDRRVRLSRLPAGGAHVLAREAAAGARALADGCGASPATPGLPMVPRVAEQVNTLGAEPATHRALEAADTLEAEGRYLDAVALLNEANRRSRAVEIEERLVRSRNRAFTELGREAPSPRSHSRSKSRGRPATMGSRRSPWKSSLRRSPREQCSATGR